MVNRWQGNTGKVVRIEEPSDRGRPDTPKKPPSPPPAGKSSPLPFLPAGLFPGGFPELETEDIILLLILYLMYRESGDSELLIIMGAMFLL